MSLINITTPVCYRRRLVKKGQGYRRTFWWGRKPRTSLEWSQRGPLHIDTKRLWPNPRQSRTYFRRTPSNPTSGRTYNPVLFDHSLCLLLLTCRGLSSSLLSGDLIPLFSHSVQGLSKDQGRKILRINRKDENSKVLYRGIRRALNILV